ncbi:DinB family protein [Flavobacterium sp. RHBU_3]|uniref:DinB family protein n=1 Tax=Flavobacterium sp. RHBU_3 TaxID=3391184 RepID=UPI0039846DAA
MEDLTQQLDGALTQTINLLNSMSEDAMNQVPFTGSWTAAQVARHLYKSQKGTDAMMLQPAGEAGRDPGERIENYREILTNYEHKMESPGFLVPENETYDKDKLINALTIVKNEILPVIGTANLNELAPIGDETPLKGSTKLEIAYFLLYHTIRHNRQIEKIKELLN